MEPEPSRPRHLFGVWGLRRSDGAALTRSGCALEVGLRDAEGAVVPRLRGEGRLVFEGFVVDL